MGEHDEVQARRLLIVLAGCIGVCIFIRLVLITSLLRPPIKRRASSEKCRIAVFLGSGGHTSEMMQLLRALPTETYHHRTYIVTTSDKFSMKKALEYESTLSEEATKKNESTPTSFDFIELPRARNVHQKWLSTPATVILAFGACCYHLVLRPLFFDRKKAVLPDLIIMNGPGTCVPIVASIYVLRVSEVEACWPKQCLQRTNTLASVLWTGLSPTTVH
jgi:beta-1,4-N-acetylglucosaminyltransferase